MSQSLVLLRKAFPAPRSDNLCHIFFLMLLYILYVQILIYLKFMVIYVKVECQFYGVQDSYIFTNFLKFCAVSLLLVLLLLLLSSYVILVPSSFSSSSEKFYRVFDCCCIALI